MCLTEWFAENPPVEWRKPVHEWIRRLRQNPMEGAEQEPALSQGSWSGWVAEVPGTGNRLVVVVCYYVVSMQERRLRALQITTTPRYRG